MTRKIKPAPGEVWTARYGEKVIAVRVMEYAAPYWRCADASGVFVYVSRANLLSRIPTWEEVQHAYETASETLLRDGVVRRGCDDLWDADGLTRRILAYVESTGQTLECRQWLAAVAERELLEDALGE